MHARTQLRDQAAAALAPAGYTVSVSRAKVLQKQELPALVVYAKSEDYQGAGHRALELVVECYTTATADMEDQLDAMAAQVEPLVLGLHGQTGVKLVDLAATELLYEPPGPDQALEPVGVARITFEVLYRAHPEAPETLAN